MATKKAATTGKKSAAKKPKAAKQTTTKVTTIKAVESRPTEKAAAKTRSMSFSFSRTPLIAALIAEFVGTFVFAATVIAGQGQPILAFFALVGVVLAFGMLSGAYVNPALVVAGWLTKRLGGLKALGFIVAEILGAMLALVVLNAFVGGAPTPAGSSDLMANAGPSLFKAAALPHGKEWFVFFAETLGALVLGFAVANATRAVKDRTAQAFTVGLGLFIGLMIAGSAAAFVGANAVLNPAVAVALQAVNFADGVWAVAIYIFGTVLGAVLGFVLYDLLNRVEKEA